jgi:ABC-2 type transport system ATP-binding protein
MTRPAIQAQPTAPADDSDVALSVRGLRFSYPGRSEPVLRDITFDLRPSEVVGVLGPNGSGKSTLLSALLDTRKGRRGGEVHFGRKQTVPRGLVGYATQQTALYRQLTVRENLLHAARILLPGGQVRASVDRCVKEFGLAEVASRPVHQLSGGWQRLVHLAVSFVHDPPVRILDEPTNALDFETRGRLVELVRGWRSRAIATLLTSHYPEDIEEMCTRIVVIRNGRAVRSAPLADLLAGLSRQLVVEATRHGTVVTGRAAAPTRLADLPAALGSAIRDCGGVDGEVSDVRLTAATLRGLLTEDPQLKGMLADED